MIFVDSSAWFAAVNSRDRHHVRATELLASVHSGLVTSDFVLVETWLLINSRISFTTAEQFISGVRSNCRIESIGAEDWRRASEIASAFPDQTFSVVDRTSFAAMERLGVTRTISFDDDFVIYRFGHDRSRSFDVLR
jgi:uncharacterized protein